MPRHRAADITSIMKRQLFLIAFSIVMLIGYGWYTTYKLSEDIHQKLSQHEDILVKLQQELEYHTTIDNLLNDILTNTNKFYLEFELITLDNERDTQALKMYIESIYHLRTGLQDLENSVQVSSDFSLDIYALSEYLLILESVGDEILLVTTTTDRYQLYRDNQYIVRVIEQYVADRRQESLQHSNQLRMNIVELQRNLEITHTNISALVTQHSLIMIFVLIVGFLLILLVMKYVFSVFMKRLELLERYATDIGDGLYHRPPFSCKDFTGRLAVRMGLMSRTIRNTFNQLNESRKEIESLAYYDSLTGLENRHLFHENLHEASVLAQRYNEHYALAYLDVDHFKKINDTYGHDIGDAVLVEISIRLTHAARENDHIARLGGDEFALLWRCDDEKSSLLIKRIQEMLLEPIHLTYQSIKVTMSVGIAILGEDTNNSKDIMRYADMALYKAKQHGRNTFHYFSEKLEQHLFHQQKVLSELETAIHSGQLELYYQTQHNMQTRHIMGVEALIRWKLPNGKYRHPNTFIPLAEECELIFGLGEWVIQQACRDASTLLKIDSHLTISLNLSSRQFEDPNLPSKLVAACEHYQVSPHNIELEITESLLLSNMKESINMLDALRLKGFNISLDDFGTGFSSNFYLKTIPVTGIKIDRLFIAGIPFERKDSAIVETTVELANRLDLKVIAEGIETEQQFGYLRDFGCDCAQGYLLNKPLPLSSVLLQLKQSRKSKGFDP